MFVLNISINGLPDPPYNPNTGRSLGPQRPDNFGRPQITIIEGPGVRVPDLPWDKINEFARTHLQDHESMMINIQGRKIPLNYTIKRNSKEIEIIAASAQFYGIDNRIIFYCPKKLGCIDFPRRNLRTYIVSGKLTLKPFIKTKPCNLEALRGFRKLASLHLEKYLAIFKEVFGIS